MGVQSYVLNILVEHYSRNEIKEGTEIFQAALRLYLFVVLAALLILLGLASLSDLTTRLNIKEISALDTSIIIITQGIWVIYNLLGGLLMSILIVIDKYPRRLIYSLVANVILLGTPIVLVTVGGTPVMTAITMTILLSVLAVVQMRDVFELTPFRIGLRETTWFKTRGLILPSLAFLGVRMSNTLLNSGIVLVLASNTGGVAVTVYSTTLMMTNFARSILGQIMSIFWPEITKLTSKDTFEYVLALHRFLLKSFLYIVSLLAGFLIVFGPQIQRAWIGAELDSDMILNIILVLYLTIQSPTLVSRIFGLAMNRQNDLLKIEFVSAISTFLLAIVLTPTWGVRGIGIALTLGQVWNTMFITRKSIIWVKDDLGSFMKDMMPIVFISISQILFSLLLVTFISGSILQLVLLIGLILFTVILFWQYGLSAFEQQRISNIVGIAYRAIMLQLRSRENI